MITQTEFVLDKLEKHLLNAEPCVKMHGYLMKIIPQDMVVKLHEIGEVRPYSLYLLQDKEFDILRIQTLQKEAYCIVDAISKTKEINIYGMRDTIKIHSIETKSKMTLEYLKEKPLQKEFKITFLTPTTYKKDNLYSNWYHLGRVLSSVVKKLNYYEKLNYDLKDIWGIDEFVKVLDYKLESCTYKIMQKSIFGFKGSVHIKLKQEADIEMLNLILQYANYSGVGAKTALGMGGVFIQ